MAVRDQNQQNLEETDHNIKQGTTRYMAPEIPGETVDITCFDSYYCVHIRYGAKLLPLNKGLKV